MISGCISKDCPWWTLTWAQRFFSSWWTPLSSSLFFCFGIKSKNCCLDRQLVTDLIFQQFNLLSWEILLHQIVLCDSEMLPLGHRFNEFNGYIRCYRIKFSVCMYAIFVCLFVFGPRVSDVSYSNWCPRRFSDVVCVLGLILHSAWYISYKSNQTVRGHWML